MSLHMRFGFLKSGPRNSTRRRARRQTAHHFPIESLEQRLLLSGTHADVDIGHEAVHHAESDAAARPNFVFILTDDQELDTMQYMPRVQELLGSTA
jgi:AmiR/NasT family two-component response regulator